MSQRRDREIAPLPSGRVGVYRAADGKRWDAYVMEKHLKLLGTFPTVRAAAAARAAYWKARELKAKRRHRYSLEDLIAGMTEENRHEETDWGPARGREVW